MTAFQHTHVIFMALHQPSPYLTTPRNVSVPLPAALLLLGLSFLTGFAIGIAVEYANLRLREIQLAHGRRLLAAQARGLRQQLVVFYRLRDGAPDGQALPKFPPFDHDEHLP